MSIAKQMLQCKQKKLKKKFITWKLNNQPALKKTWLWRRSSPSPSKYVGTMYVCKKKSLRNIGMNALGLGSQEVCLDYTEYS